MKNRFDLLLNRSFPLRRTLLVIVAVINMNASRLKAREPADRLIKRHGLLAWRNASAMLAHVDIDQHVDRLFGVGHCLGERWQRGLVIRQDAEAAARKSLCQPGHAPT